jgi:putative ABC transport system substrate-binding protein
MIKKFLVWLPVTLTLMSVPAASAQPKKVYRVGIVTRGFLLPEQTEAFRQGMRDLGYVEGRDLVIDSRFAEGKLDRLPDMVAELLRLKADVIVSNSIEAIEIVRDTSKSTPIVMSSISDPLGSGLVASLAHPGGNITGMSLYSTELAGKRLELIKETLPRVRNVALLVLRNHQPTRLLIPEMESAARAMKITVQPVEIATPEEYENAISSIVRSRAGAMFVQNNNVFSPYRAITDLANKHRLATMGTAMGFVTGGGLMGYGPNATPMWRRSATFVDKILKGTKPADIPVEQPMQFEFGVNLKTAKQIGVTIPPNVLVRADKVVREAGGNRQ